MKKPVKANEVNLLLQKQHKVHFLYGIVDYMEIAVGLVDLTTIPQCHCRWHPNLVSGAHLIKRWSGAITNGFANRMLDTTLAMATVAFQVRRKQRLQNFRINERIHHVCN